MGSNSTAYFGVVTCPHCGAQYLPAEIFTKGIEFQMPRKSVKLPRETLVDFIDDVNRTVYRDQRGRIKGVRTTYSGRHLENNTTIETAASFTATGDITVLPKETYICDFCNKKFSVKVNDVSYSYRKLDDDEFDADCEKVPDEFHTMRELGESDGCYGHTVLLTDDRVEFPEHDDNNQGT